MVDESTLRVEVRFKNARLYNAIVDRTAVLWTHPRYAAVQRANGHVSQFCKQYGLSDGERNRIYQLLSITSKPFASDRKIYTDLCVKLAAILDRSIEWLFPIDLYEQSWPRLSADVNASMCIQLGDAPLSAISIPAAQQDLVETHEESERVRSVLRTLTPREERIVRLRYGIDEDEHTLTQTSRIIGVTSERIRQIEAKALRKLRHPSRSRQLRAYHHWPRESASSPDQEMPSADRVSPMADVPTDLMMEDREWFYVTELSPVDIRTGMVEWAAYCHYAPAGANAPVVTRISITARLAEESKSDRVVVVIYGTAKRAIR